jgi:hypothetical protein
MWRLHDEALGNSKAANAAMAKEKLEALNGRIPGLIKLEVGHDFSNGEMSADLVLYSELESREALASYASHPEHQEVVKFILAICSERRVVDYEVK